MATEYILEGTGMTMSGNAEFASEDAPIVQVFTHDEFTEKVAPTLDRPIALQTITRTLACHADLFDTCTAGVIAMPDKQDLLAHPRAIGFYIDGHRLILVDDQDSCAETLSLIAGTHRRTPLSLARVLFFILENLIADDASYLEEFEARLAAAEENITDMDRAKANRTITSIRRELLRLDYYYEQMEDVGEILEENANELIESEDANLFGIFSRHANRLFDRTRTLKEYSLQLYELQQTQLDVKQNETMRWLTVVTSIFVPLTLVTSWYGMNFKGMPELDWALGYPTVIVICLIIAGVELVYLKRRKWL